MKPAYRTVTRRGEGLHVVQRSKFLGVCVPVRSEDEAARAIEAERKKHYDARHHCYAFVLGHSLKRASDDGEPSGTAGMPILEVLLRQDVRDALIVVTRYFGGVLLGTGGLVRAYSAAAKLALQDAGLADMHEAAEYRLEMDYAQYNRLPALGFRCRGHGGRGRTCPCRGSLEKTFYRNYRRPGPGDPNRPGISGLRA